MVETSNFTSKAFKEMLGNAGIKCGDCGYSFRRTYRKYAVKEYIRWCCSGRNANGVDFCDNHTIVDEAELLEAVKTYLGGLASSQDKLLKQAVAEFKKV